MIHSYIREDTNSGVIQEGNKFVSGFHSVSVHEIDKGRYESKCIAKDKYPSLEPGDMLKDGDDDHIVHCGCLQYR